VTVEAVHGVGTVEEAAAGQGLAPAVPSAWIDPDGPEGPERQT